MKLEKKFYTRFGPGEVTWVMKVEDWAKRRDDWLGKTVLTFLLPWLKELWIDIKTKETMADVDAQAESLKSIWDAEEEVMMEPIVSETKDPSSPLGISEIRIKSPWDS